MDGNLAFRGCEVHYRGFSLGPLQLEVEGPAIVCLLGTNGSGKTTMLRSALGLERLDAGEVRFDGKPLHLRQPALLAEVGYVPDSPDDVIPEMTATEFWRYASLVHAKYNGRDEHELVASAEHLADRLLMTSRHQVAGTLSFGNRRKLQLIVGLLHRPRLVLLDEPFTGLDFVASDLLEQVLVEQREAGSVILLTTHDLAVPERIAERVVLLRDGAVVLDIDRSTIELSGWRKVVIDAATKPVREPA